MVERLISERLNLSCLKRLQSSINPSRKKEGKIREANETDRGADLEIEVFSPKEIMKGLARTVGGTESIVRTKINSRRELKKC